VEKLFRNLPKYPKMPDDLQLDEMLAALKLHAANADGDLTWPAASWQAMCHGGAVRWCIPTLFGGDAWEGERLFDGYEHLASACLTSCFILSQRDAACRRLRDSDNRVLAQELLPQLAAGSAFATVGLSQLTTSRQHVRPALAVRQQGDEFVLDGMMPWVTGASRADYFVTGAVLDDGRQILAVLPANLPGVTVGRPAELMALQGSLTAEVRCDLVHLERRWILAGPAEKVMGAGRGGAGGLETSCLALGLARAAVTYLEDEAASRSDLEPIASRLEHARALLRQELHQAARTGCSAENAAALRGRANTLVLRATQAALTASKGAGFLRSHPAQRWARQAMFFLVWSCPRPAVEATMAYFASETCIE
jgi:alkylation response protein AidB-like acyl-CoA dehydrogenase